MKIKICICINEIIIKSAICDAYLHKQIFLQKNLRQQFLYDFQKISNNQFELFRHNVHL